MTESAEKNFPVIRTFAKTVRSFLIAAVELPTEAVTFWRSVFAKH
jgi:DNA-binding MltR family transcriptional regulator